MATFSLQIATIGERWLPHMATFSLQIATIG